MGALSMQSKSESAPSKPPLRVVIVGHVDHGKSTLVGRLLHDTKSLPQGKKEQLEQACKRRGVPFEWAFLMDALKAERDQNITIDTSQIFFQSAVRRYVLIDAPGHREFLKNMVSGAASADAAIVLVAADEGILEQSRRHAYLLSLLGVSEVLVVVNKMDRVGYSREPYEELVADYGAFLRELGVRPRAFIPISAKSGDHVATPSTHLPWYPGKTLLEELDAMTSPQTPSDGPLRFVVQDIYRFDQRRIVAGRIESGSLAVGDSIHFSPLGRGTTVRSIERFQGSDATTASAGEAVGLTLADQIFVRRGQIAHAPEAAPLVGSRVRVRLFWMGARPLVLGGRYKLRVATLEVEARVVSIEQGIDASSLECSRAPAAIKRDEVAELTLETKVPFAFDRHLDQVSTGRFVLVDGYDVCGGGIIISDAFTPKQEQGAIVTRGERERRNGHRGAIVLLAPADRQQGELLTRELFVAGLEAAYLTDPVAVELLLTLGFIVVWGGIDELLPKQESVSVPAFGFDRIGVAVEFVRERVLLRKGGPN